MTAPGSINTAFGLARAVAVAAFGLALSATAASADFRLCNATNSRVGVAIGYKNGKTWVSEGWWNIAASNCETLLKGPLVARYYYVYALDYDHGGEWGGKSYMCTRSHEFTIRGLDHCRARGYDRTGFFEIDTGDQRSWIVQLTEGQSTAPVAAAHPAVATGRASAAADQTAQADPKPKKPAP
jgi:uncharacterized membrane protein